MTTTPPVHDRLARSVQCAVWLAGLAGIIAVVVATVLSVVGDEGDTSSGDAHADQATREDEATQDGEATREDEAALGGGADPDDDAAPGDDPDPEDDDSTNIEVADVDEPGAVHPSLPEGAEGEIAEPAATTALGAPTVTAGTAGPTVTTRPTGTGGSGGAPSATTTTTTSSTITPSTVPPDVGTGDVQVTLLWAGDADVDLHVIDPAGEELDYSTPFSSSGGQLDRDEIPECGETGDHAENVFWPTGAAPPGQYQAYVHYYGGCGTGASQTVQLTITVRGTVVSEQVFALVQEATSAVVRFAVG